MVKFIAKIETTDRKSIVKELTWFLIQLQDEADGGGTDSQEMQSDWTIEGETYDQAT